MPQFTSIGKEQEVITQKTKEINNLKTSINTINSSSTQDILDSLHAVNAALPSSKDIVAIYGAITTLATKSNINIREFSLKIGKLYNSGKSKTLSLEATENGTPILSVIISVHSDDNRNVFTFSQELYKILPLAEIQKIGLNNGDGNFEVNFFYKPYDANIIAQQTDVQPLTPQEKKVLADLKVWGGQ